MDYGAVYTGIRMVTKRDGVIGTYVYNNDNSTCNHAVALVGWNDSIAIPGAPGTGAWIVKNSWGENWGDNGVYYISYEDCLVESQMRGVTSVSDVEYDNLYQYDILN